MGLKGWDPNCIYRQRGGTMSKMPAPLRFLQNFQVLLAERISRIFLQLQIRNSGREIIQTIPFRIWKMLTRLSPTSYLYTSYLFWEMLLRLLKHSPLFHGPSTVTSLKTGKGGNIRGLCALGDGASAPSWSLKLPSKAGQDTRKELLSMVFISSGECGAQSPKS